VTTFYLIRHGEKDADERLMVGRTRGIHLSSRGQEQAAAIAERLRECRIQHVFSSPLERARETAAPLARVRGVEVQLLEGLHEYDFGEWTGMSQDELRTIPEWQNFNSFRSATRPPGGEAMLEVQERFVREMVRLRAAYPNDEVALVSHGDPLRAAVCYFVGMPLDLYQRIEINVASISVLTLDQHGVQLVRLNEIVGRSCAP
jgi:probable phosphoglycerate mutase